MSFACKKLCGHKLKRPHASCLWCRVRRYFYGKMDPKKYHYNRYMGIVMPTQQTTYIIFIDNGRRFAKAKGAILKFLLTICEGLAN